MGETRAGRAGGTSHVTFSPEERCTLMLAPLGTFGEELSSVSWREEASSLREPVTWISRGHLPRTWASAVRARAVGTRQRCQPALEAQGRQGCCGGRGRPCRYLSRLILRAPDQKWRFSTDFSVTSVSSCLLARGRRAWPRGKKNHYVELACLPSFNWNKMGALLSGTACAEEPG